MGLSSRAKLYIVAIALIGLASLGYFGTKVVLSGEAVIASLLFLFFIVVSDLFCTSIPDFGSRVSASIALWVSSALVLGGPLGVVVATVATLISELFLRAKLLAKKQRASLYAIIFNTGQVTVSLSGLAVLMELLHMPVGALVSPADYGKAFLCFSAVVMLNSLLVSGVVSLSTGQEFRYLTTQWFRDFAIQYLILAVSTMVIVVLYSLSTWYMLLGIAPLVLVHLSFRSYVRIREQARRTFEKVAELLDKRDPYTGRHSREVAELSAALARRLGLRGSEVEMVRAIALVHDIGKIAVPDRVLLKAGELTDEEWELMKQHTTVGYDLIKGLEVYGRYAEAVKYEHEHWDGSGYPDGLKGEEIPLVARIIAVADVYNALTTDRPYRKAYPKEKAIEIMREMAGKTLDPHLVEVFLELLEEED